jgi:DnaJ-class molecular chaperone
VTRLSSAISIKQAYRRIALNSHPDKVAPDVREQATRRFQEVQVAYAVLSDPVKRRDYDGRTFGQHTPPGSFSERDEERQSWSPGWEMPPTPESPGWGTRNGFGNRHSWHSNDSGFRQQFSAQDLPKHVMTFAEATLLFHPEDRRHLWLSNEEDDPAGFGGQQIFKPLHVSLQEYILRSILTV